MAEELVTVEVLPDRDHMGPDGGIVGAGGTYKTTPRQAKELVARRLVKIVDTPEPPAAEEGGEKTTAPEEERWTLKITPAEFLERFPEAKNANAALARKLVAAGRGNEVAGADTATSTASTTTPGGGLTVNRTEPAAGEKTLSGAPPSGSTPTGTADTKPPGSSEG